MSVQADMLKQNAEQSCCFLRKVWPRLAQAQSLKTFSVRQPIAC